MRIRQSDWLVATVNLAAGLILWFGYCTDFSWAGTVPDYVYPPLVGVVAMVSLLRGEGANSLGLTEIGGSRRARRLYKMACLPSLTGGVLGLVAVIIYALGSLINLLFMAFVAGNSNLSLVQSIPSPGGTRFADVYFKKVDGGYSGGRGPVTVRVRYYWLPFAERDILRFYSYPDSGYVRWKDEDTLVINGDPASRAPYERELGFFSFQLPEIIRPGSFLNPRSSK